MLKHITKKNYNPISVMPMRGRHFSGNTNDAYDLRVGLDEGSARDWRAIDRSGGTCVADPDTHGSRKK